MVGEKHRSHLLYKQVEAFEDKVYLCHDNFSVDIMYSMFAELSKRLRPGQLRIRSLARIRQIVNDERRKIRMRNRHRKVTDAPPIQEDRVIKYFAWFFDYIKYLRELRENFVERVFNPLFQYFYENGSSGPDRQLTRDSAASVSQFSVASFKSFDSGMSGLSGISSINELSGLVDSDDTDSMATTPRGDYGDDIQETRKKMASRNALLLLGREFRDVKTLYDTTDIEKLAHRISYVKEQLDYLIDNESKVDHEIFSQDSERSVYHLKIKEQLVDSLMRFIPDILVKFQKAAWLARRWLELDDIKTKDVNQRLDKLCKFEERMGERLSLLSKEIQEHEQALEKGSNELQQLFKREERANDLSQAMYELDQKITEAKESLKTLQDERSELAAKITVAVQTKNATEYKKLKSLYERNKLQRYAIDRQLATLGYHKTIAENDMQIELQLKPSMIHFTNDVQDHCEELEQRLETERKEKRTLQAALLPIVEDKQCLTDRLRQQQSRGPAAGDDGIVAEYLGSFKYITPSRTEARNKGHANWTTPHIAAQSPMNSKPAANVQLPTTPDW
jgi:hypothetical protein